MAKYERNPKTGLFDCPVTGCDRKGKHGLTSGAAVGAHMRHAHKGIVVATAGAANGNGAEAEAAEGFKALGLAAPPVQADPAALMALGLVPPTKATDAIVAILKLPELRELPTEQVGTVFDTVKSIIELDTGNPADDLRRTRDRRARDEQAATGHGG